MVSRKVFEYKEFVNNNLQERAQITLNGEPFVQNVGRVYVYGGGLTGNQREHGIPHFKLVKSNGEEYRIIIPQKTSDILNLDDIIILDDNVLSRKEMKLVLKWLGEQSLKIKKTSNENKTNLFYIARLWNDLNLEDNNVQIIDASIYKEDN